MTRHPLSPAAGALVRSAIEDATNGTARVGFDDLEHAIDAVLNTARETAHSVHRPGPERRAALDAHNEAVRTVWDRFYRLRARHEDSAA